MKKISVKFLHAINVSVEEPVYCELEFKSKSFKTKVFKNDTELDQLFNLGIFKPNDNIPVNILCKKKHSGDILEKYNLPLNLFSFDGEFEHSFSLEKICQISLKIIISAGKGHVRRSSSIKNITGKLSRFIFQNEEKKETEEDDCDVERAASICHSQSHTVNLNNLSEEEKKKSKTVTRTLSDENLKIKPKRRERRRTKPSKANTDITKSPNPNRKRRRDKTPLRNENDKGVESSPKCDKRKKTNKETNKKKKEKEEKSEEDSISQEKNDKPKKRVKKIKKEGTDVNTDKFKPATSKKIPKKYDEKPGSPKIEKKSPNPEKRKKKTIKDGEKINKNKDVKDDSKNEKSEDIKPKKVGKRTTVTLQPIGKSTKLFGVELETVMANQKERNPDLIVPEFFVTASAFIKENGFAVQGIFRIRGKLKDVRELKEKIDSGVAVGSDYNNVHLVATLLKAFLRELPTPILTFENYSPFIACADYKGEEQIKKLADIMNSLPKVNHDLLRFIFELLNELSKHSSTTQMTAENLAKVISPNLIWKKEVDIMDLSVVQDTLKCNDLAVIMIDHYDKLFTM